MTANAKANIWLILKDQITAPLAKTKKNFDSFAKTIAIGAAEIAAVGYTLKKSFEFIEFGAKVEQQRLAFNALANSMKADSKVLLESLQKASKETISTMDLMRDASAAMALGIKPDELVGLMEAASSAALALGKDTATMFNDIVSGSARQSKMILDNLSILVDMETVYKKFAEEHGKKVEQLTEQGRKYAFIQEVLRQGQETTKKLGDITQTTAKDFEAFKAGLVETKIIIAEFTKEMFLTVMSTDSMKEGIRKVNIYIKEWSENLIIGTQATIKFIQLFKEIGTDLFSPFAVDVGYALERIKNFDQEVRTVIDDLYAQNEARRKRGGFLGGIIAGEGSSVDVTLQQFKEFFSEVEQAGITTAESLKKSFENFTKTTQSQMSSIFYDGFQGELKSASDYFETFTESLKRIWANTLAEMVMEKSKAGLADLLSAGASFFSKGNSAGSFFKNFVTGGSSSSMGSNILDALKPFLGSFAVGTPYISKDGFAQVHKGEAIVPAHENQQAQAVTVNFNINAVDAASFMTYMPLIKANLSEALASNGSFRGSIKRNM